MWKANFYRKDNLWKWGGSPFNSISNSDSILRKQDVVFSLWWISYFTKFCADRWVNPSNLCKLKSIWWGRMLCILTSLWVLHPPKSWSKPFFQQFFNLFCYFQSFFSDFTAEITKKRLKMNKKMWFCLLIKAGWHAKAGRLPEGVPQICLFSVDF